MLYLPACACVHAGYLHCSLLAQGLAAAGGVSAFHEADVHGALPVLMMFFREAGAHAGCINCTSDALP